MSSAVVAGVALAAAGFGAKYAVKAFQQLEKNAPAIKKSLTFLDFSGYYKGGFNTKMDKMEAARILGVSPASPISRIRESHRRIMILNHPDKGGSPYLASKINEAKDLLEKKK
eukprot:Nk52_evm18s372 gene=Nk52_evmTU18s372